MDQKSWTGSGKVRAREAGGVFELTVDGLTTQARYYKVLLYEFFRKDWRGGRPAFGDHAVEVVMEHVGEPPHIDLDNIAKAVLDGVKKHVFRDDAQVARLLVERREGERERLIVTIRRR